MITKCPSAWESLRLQWKPTPTSRPKLRQLRHKCINTKANAYINIETQSIAAHCYFPPSYSLYTSSSFDFLLILCCSKPPGLGLNLNDSLRSPQQYAPGGLRYGLTTNRKEICICMTTPTGDTTRWTKIVMLRIIMRIHIINGSTEGLSIVQPLPSCPKCLFID